MRTILMTLEENDENREAGCGLAVGDTYTDASGATWRVVAIDGDGVHGELVSSRPDARN